MMHPRLAILRIFRRLRFAFAWRDVLSWEYESCERCGHCFRVCWSASDESWNAIHGDDGGCLCIDCFVELAERKGVKPVIERMEVFSP